MRHSDDNPEDIIDPALHAACRAKAKELGAMELLPDDEMHELLERVADLIERHGHERTLYSLAAIIGGAGLKGRKPLALALAAYIIAANSVA